MSSSTSSSEHRPRSLLRRGLAAASALLVPLGALAATVAVLQVCAETRGGDIITTLDERLIDRDATLVLFGNSIARTGIDGDALDRGLRPFVEGVVDLSIDGTFPAHWYAILVHDVFGQGMRPRMVVLYANVGAFEQVEIDSEHDRARFLRLPGADSPALVDRLFGGRRSLLQLRRLEDARFTVRESIVGGLVHTVVGLAFPINDGQSVRANGVSQLLRASRVLFANVGKAKEVVGAAPVVAADRKPVTTPDGRDLPMADTLLPELTALCVEHGARLVVVAAPPRPDGRSPCGKDPTIVPFLPLIDRLPMDFIDATRLPVSADVYQDGFHVTEAGRPIVTAGLAMALLDSRAVLAQPDDPGALYTVRCPNP